jgi:hypothetical protein
MENKNCIVRFAPSPTGYIHIGNTRIAIINYLLAKSLNGKFILRIDDTDQNRCKQEYIDGLMENLEWLDIKHEEVFNQSKKVDIYNNIIKKMVEDGHQLILHTMRCNHTKDIEPIGNGIIGVPSGNYLDDAVNWFKANGIPLYAINENPDQKKWTTSPKLYADMYIDDAALGIALCYEGNEKPYVAWYFAYNMYLFVINRTKERGE